MRSAITCLVVLVVLRGSFAAVTVDFDDLPFLDETNRSSLDSRGFHFSTDAGHSFYTFYSSTNNRLTTRQDAVVTMTKTVGGVFAIDHLDLAEGNAPSGSTSIMVTGFFSSGGSTSQTLTLDGNYATIQTFSLSGFTGLSSALLQPLNGQTFSVDNIVTPEPIAAILIASATVMLRRKRR